MFEKPEDFRRHSIVLINTVGEAFRSCGRELKGRCQSFQSITWSPWLSLQFPFNFLHTSILSAVCLSSVCLHLCLSVCIFNRTLVFCPSVCLSFCLSIFGVCLCHFYFSTLLYPSVHPTVSSSFCPSSCIRIFHLPVCPSVYLSVHQSTCLPFL